jgi:Holliday junction DNA helicase RuvA
MIARLKGTLISKSPASVLLEVAGVGYQVAVPLSTFSKLGPPGQEAVLLTYLAVRENALELYGFATPAEKEMFELMLGVTGIGPKLALAVLSGAEVHLLRRAIASGDVDLLTTVPGIGRKTAQRILVELREKMGEAWQESAVPQPPGAGDAVDALVALGYPRASAAAHVQKATAAEPGLTAEGLVRKALALARQGSASRN